MKEIREVDDFNKIIKKDNWKVFGIGGLPETRSEGHFVVENFEIICSRGTGELNSVRKKIKVNVFNIDRDSKKAEHIISNEKVRKYINSFKDKKKIAIYLFKSSKIIEEICQKNDWTLIAAESETFEKINTRDFFLGSMNKIGEKRDFDTFKVEDFSENKNYLLKRFGEKFVVQTFYGAGGNGTFFVEKNNFEKVCNLLKKDDHREVIVTKFFKGIDMAISGCVTKENGTIPGVPRNQFVGLKEAVEGKEGSKHSFCGNDWNLDKYQADLIEEQARDYVEKIGEILKHEGFLGIFGIDFIYNPEERKLYPLEINPRLVGSYPIETQFEVANKIIPLVGFHFLEFLGLSYIFSGLEKNLRKTECSHLIISNFEKSNVFFEKNFKGGVYEVKDEKLNFVREGFELQDIKRVDKELIITAGALVKGYLYKKNNQFFRIVWAKSIIDENRSGRIKDKFSKEIDVVKKEVKELIKIK